LTCSTAASISASRVKRPIEKRIELCATSSGSACTSASLEPSYVLRALGLPDEVAHSSIRFSIGRFTREAEIDAAVEQVKRTVERLRDLSPLWDMHCAGVDLSTVQWAEH
jgi:cysteine desulfurase